jgi:hypothetical protein
MMNIPNRNVFPRRSAPANLLKHGCGLLMKVSGADGLSNYLEAYFGRNPWVKETTPVLSITATPPGATSR